MRELRSLQNAFRAAAIQAGLLALAPALSVCPVLAETNPALSGDTLIVVSFSGPACNGLWPDLETELARSEMQKLTGGSLLWIRRDEFRGGMEFQRTYVVILPGDCGMAAGSANADETRGPLGWVLLVGKQIQPFMYVDADRVAQMLHQDLRDKTTAERRLILARAISRIIAHELTHVVTQSKHHTATGLQKARVTRSDLLSQ